MIAKLSKLADLTLASALGVALMATPALADGMARRGSIKDAPAPEARRCALSANVALATEYVFRGVSQTSEDPAIQGGFDATCGMFYAGVWASSLDWDVNSAGTNAASIEIDWYAGIKPKTDRITWDLGVIYYTYPSGSSPSGVAPGFNLEPNYVELKIGGSAEIWKDGTFGVTAFWSPDYQFETGNVWTFEFAFAQALPKVGMFSPTFSALLGYQVGDDTAYNIRIANGEDNYLYWNAGVTLGFLEKWSLDLRYWDTNLDSGTSSSFCRGGTFQCDERFVATLKFAY